jgi:superfamily I DNA/RNA helicase
LKHAVEPTVADDIVPGAVPVTYICDSAKQQTECVNRALDELKGVTNDIVILTCKTETASALIEHSTNGQYEHKGHEYKFTSCRKFKGLEADAVLLIDIDENTFNSDEVFLFYAGASRARNLLYLIMNFSDDECAAVAKQIAGKASGKPRKDLASVLNSILKR